MSRLLQNGCVFVSSAESQVFVENWQEVELILIGSSMFNVECWNATFFEWKCMPGCWKNYWPWMFGVHIDGDGETPEKKGNCPQTKDYKRGLVLRDQSTIVAPRSFLLKHRHKQNFPACWWCTRSPRTGALSWRPGLWKWRGWDMFFAKRSCWSIQTCLKAQKPLFFVCSVCLLTREQGKMCLDPQVFWICCHRVIDILWLDLIFKALGPGWSSAQCKARPRRTYRTCSSLTGKRTQAKLYVGHYQ